MESVICIKCGELLDKSMFYKNKANKSGIQQPCKNCKKQYQINYNLKHREQINERMREYHKVPEVKERRREYSKTFYRENKNKHQKYYKEYIKLPEKKELIKNYRDSVKLDGNLHSSIKASLKQDKPYYWCYSVLDFDYFQLVHHLESQFIPEMNWSNYGLVWELDHIIPKNQFSFNSYDDIDFKICWSLINLRPILKSDNRSRPKDGSDIPEELKYKILHQFDRKEENL